MPTETTQKPFSRTEIGHCNKCGKVVRRQVTGIRVRTESWGVCGFKSSTRETQVQGDGPAYCACRKGQKLLLMRAIEGHVRPEIPCDARCTEAKGHRCECSCGGKNHGSGHA